MSKEYHPNLHAVQFATSIIEAFYNSIRPDSLLSKDKIPDIREDVLDFVDKIECKVDEAV